LTRKKKKLFGILNCKLYTPKCMIVVCVLHI